MKLAISLIFGSLGWSQTGGLSILNGVIDLSGAGHTATVKVVASVGALPSTGCTPGELAFVTAATLGQQVYTNSGSGSCVWTQMLAGSGGTTVNNLKCNRCTLNGTALTNTFPNAAVTGTTLNKLAKLTGAGTVVLAGNGDTGGVVGIVDSGAGTTGSAEVTIQGTTSCVFDNATTADDYVTISSTTAGDCHDSGATYPVGTQVIGRVLSTNGGAGTYSVMVFGPEFQTIATGTALPNGVTAATQSAGDNSTKVATTAYADNVGNSGCYWAQIVTASSATSVDFTSIPATCTNLRLTWTARSSSSGTTFGMYIQINADSTQSHYGDNPVYYSNIAGISTGSSTSAGIYLANMAGTGANASYQAEGVAYLNGYASTTFYKAITITGTCPFAGGWQWFRGGANYASTSAISRLTLTLDSSKVFTDGSVFTLYGEK